MKKGGSVESIIIRYLILIAVAIPNMWILFEIFTPLTIYPVKWILSIFFSVSSISGNTLLLNQTISIELISACVAGAAYYLLLMLNLFTPGIKIKKRIYMILSAFGIFLIVNILRIVILSALAYSHFAFFDITHEIFWYAISTVFVVGIWFWQVKAFKIREIPLYSDLKFLYDSSRRK